MNNSKMPMRFLIGIFGEDGYSPYVPVTGSRKIPISGARKVNTINAKESAQSAPKAILGRLQSNLWAWNSRVSYRYATAADTKKMLILSQSGDLPIAPL